jgi:DNA-binding ferritin-like protein
LVLSLEVIAARMREVSLYLPSSLGRLEPPYVKNLCAENPSLMIAKLVSLHEASAKHARNVAELAQNESDDKTGELLLECINFHVKASWMLRALIY